MEAKSIVRAGTLLHGRNLRTLLCPQPSAILMGELCVIVGLPVLPQITQVSEWGREDVNLNIPQLEPLALKRGAPTAL